MRKARLVGTEVRVSIKLAKLDSQCNRREPQYRRLRVVGALRTRLARSACEEVEFVPT